MECIFKNVLKLTVFIQPSLAGCFYTKKKKNLGWFSAKLVGRTERKPTKLKQPYNSPRLGTASSLSAAVGNGRTPCLHLAWPGEGRPSVWGVVSSSLDQFLTSWSALLLRKCHVHESHAGKTSWSRLHTTKSVWCWDRQEKRFAIGGPWKHM